MERDRESHQSESEDEVVVLPTPPKPDPIYINICSDSDDDDVETEQRRESIIQQENEPQQSSTATAITQYVPPRQVNQGFNSIDLAYRQRLLLKKHFGQVARTDPRLIEHPVTPNRAKTGPHPPQIITLSDTDEDDIEIVPVPPKPAPIVVTVVDSDEDDEDENVRGSSVRPRKLWRRQFGDMKTKRLVRR